MEKKEQEKKISVELDDKALDNVSGGYVEEIVPPDIIDNVVGAITEA